MGNMKATKGPQSRWGQVMHGPVGFSWGRVPGISMTGGTITCPYSNPMQVSLVQTISEFYDMTKTYRRIYEQHATTHAEAGFVHSRNCAVCF